MKSRTLAVRATFAAVLLLLALHSPLWSDDNSASRSAQLNFVRGSVSFQAAGAGENDWIVADPNRPLVAGDRLWADTDSRAELHIGSIAVRLDDHTGLILVSLNDNVVQLELPTGSMIVHVPQLEAGEKFEVEAPNLTFSLLGAGDYRLDVDPEKQVTVITVREGEGQAAGGGHSYKVIAGQRVTFTVTDVLDYDLADAHDTPFTEFDQWAANRDSKASQQVQASAYPRSWEYVNITPTNARRPPLYAHPFTYSPSGHFLARNVTLVDLIVNGAYQNQTRRIQMRGGPDWIDTERFDIDGQTDASTGPIAPEEWSLMLQALLADQFKLVLHRETKDMSVYALVAADPPKLQPSMEGERTAFMRDRDGRMEFRNVPITGLVNSLSNVLHVPVVDATGIQGSFDFMLDPTQFATPASGVRRVVNAESSTALLLTALRQQLGFELKERKQPLEITFVDHAERPRKN